LKVLVITANPKSKGALATLTSEAARGASEAGAEVEEIRLADLDIAYCRFCFKCLRDTESEIGSCSQDDDMRWILERAREADGFILASQLSSAHANARFKTFFERCAYTAGRSSRILFLHGLPRSRFTDKQRYSVALVTAGGIPSWLKVFCNVGTRQMKEMSSRSFNAKTVGTLYAGMVRKGLKERYRRKAYRLGRELAQQIALNR
jgi:multimeric flavodoxin WrbA